MTTALAPEGTQERETQDLAFLDHLAERHGLKSFACPKCHAAGCRFCAGHGVLFTMPSKKACGPNCSAPARFALVKRLAAQ